MKMLSICSLRCKIGDKVPFRFYFWSHIYISTPSMITLPLLRMRARGNNHCNNYRNLHVLRVCGNMPAATCKLTVHFLLRNNVVWDLRIFQEHATGICSISVVCNTRRCRSNTSHWDCILQTSIEKGMIVIRSSRLLNWG
jgi:hypothetical protein